MSYTPTTWKAGDIVTSAKLNKIEQGISTATANGNILIVNAIYDDEDISTLDKTWKEIYNAMLVGSVIIIENTSTNNVYQNNVISAIYKNDKYYIETVFFAEGPSGIVPIQWTFSTTSENGYPNDNDTDEEQNGTR